MSKNPPDWWARFIGGSGIVIALFGLWLTYNNNRWQKEVYEKSLEERIFVQLSGLLSYPYPFIKLVPSHDTEPPPKEELTELAVEVVNLGLQPIYLKSVTAQFGEQRASFYEHDPLNTKEPMRRLEPGEAASYKIEWPSDVYGTSLAEYIDKAKGRAIVEVQTTKKQFSQSAQISRVTFVEELPLNVRHFEELKKLTPRHRK